MDEDEWTAIADRFEELERHPTSISGDLLIVRLESVLAAVEQPTPGKRVVRRLDDLDEARRFVEQRLQVYDRMWDGCGCKIDYYS
jgi:tetrahydromethanopterin S-methyltransferase subunit G